MKKILLPTDFSENAYNAIKYAVQLYKEEECHFYLLNTYTPVIYDNEYLLFNATQPSLDEIYRTNSAKGLAKVLDRLKKKYSYPKHSYEQISSFNMLNDEIKKQVREKEIDLIVMGTQGATGADRVLFGSNTVHAIKKAECPLLMIPSDFEYKKPENILFPTDFDIEYSNKQLQLFLDIAARNKSKIHVVNVYFGIALSDEQEAHKKLLSGKLGDISHQFYSIEKKSVPQTIHDFQKQNAIEMLAMINNKHSFFENLLFRPVVNTIGFHTQVPFLVIPSGKYKP